MRGAILNRLRGSANPACPVDAAWPAPYRRPMGSRLLPRDWLAILCVLGVSSAAHATDLAGRWRVLPSYWGPFAEIEQTGSNVSIVLDSYPTYFYDGSISGADVTATTDDAPC